MSDTPKVMAKSKTPELDGFSIDFYKFFLPDIKETFHDSYICFKQGDLGSEQRIFVLSLIPKRTKMSDFLNLGDRPLFMEQIIRSKQIHWP